MAKPLVIRNVEMTLEPDRDARYRDREGDYWWYGRDEGGEIGWVWGIAPGEEGQRSAICMYARTWSADSIPDLPWTLVNEPALVLQDSGARTEYQGGGVRDSAEGKPRFDLLFPEGVPYEAQFLTQVAQVLEQGAKKYAPRNWEAFHTADSLEHAKASLGRHYVNYMAGSQDEPHLALMACNLLFLATIQWKIDNGWKPVKEDES